ncbi:hypothetical protein ACLB1R_01895 [Escherichia coli]
MKDIESISTIINDILKHKLSLLPQKCLTKIQDEVPNKYIFNLHRNGSNNYIGICVDNHKNKITPTGEWLYVVTIEDPCNVIMISQSDINSLLLSSSFIGVVGIGHSSLTRKGIELKEQNRMYIKERARIANRFNRKGGCYAIDVYLAGEILFNDFGQIVNWNNNSGHYKISKEVSMVNYSSSC